MAASIVLTIGGALASFLAGDYCGTLRARRRIRRVEADRDAARRSAFRAELVAGAVMHHLERRRP